MFNNNATFKILISGEGGQGVKKMSGILAEAMFKSGYNIISMPHYGVEMRMGISMSFLEVYRKDLVYPKFLKADILVALTGRDIQLVKKFQSRNTLIINGIGLESYLVEKGISAKSLNILMLGILVKNLVKYDIKLSPGLIKDIIREKLLEKGNIGHNIDAFNLGLVLDKNSYLTSLDNIKSPILKSIVTADSKKEHIIFPHLCKGCGICIEKCPYKALTWSDKKNFISQFIPKVAIDKCTACKTCQEFCPDSAIKVEKK